MDSENQEQHPGDRHVIDSGTDSGASARVGGGVSFDESANMSIPSTTHMSPESMERNTLRLESTMTLKELSRYHPDESHFSRCENPIDFSFHNISFVVQVKDGKETKTKKILDSVTGRVKSGHILAIMGPSGAGKTSLLQILSLKTRHSGIRGRILANNVEITKRSLLRRFASFVSQDDVMTATLTVRETFRFYAGLKMPAGTTAEQREARVNEVIELLQLEKAADTLVGNEMIRGISGGEKRRVTIGVELLIDPTLIFMDEPTSGLDSSTAVAIMELLQSLAMSGRTIVCTIHQPRSSVYWMFDQVLLLSKGKTIFLGGTQKCIDFLANNGYELPEFENPADHALDTLTMYDQEDAEEKIQRLHDAFMSSAAGEHLEQKVHASGSGSVEDIDQKFPKKARSSWSDQFRWIMWREYKTMSRDMFQFWGKVFQAVLNGLLIGLVFLQLDSTQASIVSRYGMLLFLVVGTGFVNVIGQVQVMPSKRLIFDRERSSGSYSVSAFYWGLTVSDFPVQLLLPTLSTVLVYWTVGLQNDAEKFFVFWGILMVAFQAAFSIGFLIGSSVPNVEVGLALGPIIMVTNMLFAGFFVNLDDIPVFLRWISYVSFVRYGFQALSINEYTGLSLTCSSEELRMAPGGVCPITTGQQALTAFEMNKFDIWICAVILLALCLFFRTMTLVALWRHDKKRQN